MNFSSEENIFSVSEINRHLKNVIETNIPNLFVEGEIANFTNHFSGHMYFSLKDESSTIRCVFFKTWNRYLDFKPKDGDKVICGGKLGVYEKSGSYQLNVTRMYPNGMGDLQLRFEELKRRLSEDGLFDQEHKKPIPRYPQKIGVITSATGAAFQDIRNVISRRWSCDVVLYPTKVQGDEAPRSLIEGIRYFSQSDVDVIIIGRGGGTQEDLFVFNDEMLARTIFDCLIPVISAVGHEIDFTICDFVSDLRAPTPSAAAEIAVPDRTEVQQTIDAHLRQMNLITRDRLNRLQRLLQYHENRLDRSSPLTKLHTHQQQLDELIYRMLRTGRMIDSRKNNLMMIQERFRSAMKAATGGFCRDCRYRLDKLTARLVNSTERLVERKHTALEIQAGLLEELSPNEVLKRGYAITRKAGEILRSVQQANISDTILVELRDGNLNCEVRAIEKNTEKGADIT